MSHHVPFTSDEEIAILVHGFLACALPKTAWTHAAHWAVAIWLLSNRSPADVAKQMPDMIRAYNESVGTENSDHSGYHDTITQASIRAAQKFLALRPGEPLFLVSNALMRSPLGNPNWLLTYWSRELLFSVQARHEWLEPDLQRLPF